MENTTIPILLMRLEGPLQSWGERSKWDYRDTSPFPSKSGIIGMIGCAMGIERTDSRLGIMCNQLSMAVRADRKGQLITDYQTVTAEIILNAERKKRTGGSTIILHRSYLQDASFLVALTLRNFKNDGDISLLSHIQEAFENPVWIPYLGRKSCVPSVPLLPKLTYEYVSLEQALRMEPPTGRADQNMAIEVESTDGSGYLRSDVRLPSENRSFTYRRVSVLPVRHGEEQSKEGFDNVSQ